MSLVPLPAWVMRQNAEMARFASVPEKLDKIVDVVLAHKIPARPKRKKRKKKAKRATA